MIGDTWGHTGNYLQRGIAHGIVRGILARVQGGNFSRGFMSAFASVQFGRFSQALRDTGNAVKAVFHALVGGTVSLISGGKFGNGAVSAAVVYLFNDMGKATRSYIKSLNARQILQVDKFRQYVENMDLKTFNKTFNLYLTSDSEMWIYKADIYKQLNPAIIRGAYDMTQQAIKDIGGTKSLSAPIKAVYHLFGPGGEIGYDFIEGTTTLRGIYEIH